MRSEAISRFRREFGREPSWVGEAPGRVNLIGEHVDYLGGLVLPAAIDRWTAVAGGPNPEWDVRSEVPGGLPYVMAVGEELGAGPQAVAIASGVPPAAGVSSSAALLVAVAAGLAPDAGGMEMALLCRRAEHIATGVGVGVMDQVASALGVEGHALLVDCAALTVRPLPFPETLSIAVLDSGVRRRLADTPYEDRRRTAQAALAAANRPLGEMDAASAPAELKHSVSETDRVRRFAAALEAGRVDELGPLLDESHASLRDDLRVSTPEVDAVVGAARSAPGCTGARVMGAGFGGSVLALVAAGHRDAFLAAMAVPGFICRTASGPFAR